jgi:hypothetical protein
VVYKREDPLRSGRAIIKGHVLKTHGYNAGEYYLAPYVPRTGGLNAKNEYVDADSPQAAELAKAFAFIFKGGRPSQIEDCPTPSPRSLQEISYFYPPSKLRHWMR